MNRYLRMGTRRSGVPRAKSYILPDGEPALAREDSAAIDSVYDGIERELEVGEGLLDEDEEEDIGGAPGPDLGRAWCGERGAYVEVRSPKGPVSRR